MKKEIRNRVLSIIAVSTFLIIMTKFAYVPRQTNLLSALSFLNQQQSFYMEDLSEGLLLKSAVPTKDSEGLEIDPYTFKVINNTNKNITYNIIFKNNEEKAKQRGKEVLPSHYLKYVVSDINDSNLDVKTLNEDGVLLTTTIPPKSEQVFNFRMWLDYNADDDAMNKIFIGTIEVEKAK